MKRKKIWQASAVLCFWMVVGCLSSGQAYAQIPGHDGGPVVSRIVIDVQGVPGDPRPWVDLTQSLIFLQEGEPFSDKRLQDSVNALKASNLFKEIKVPDPEWAQQEITLRFQVTPFRRIKDIAIQGAFPILEREILNAMKLYTGGGFDEKQVPEKENAIAGLFRNEGYIAPEVNIVAEEDPEDGSVIVYVNIDKGGFYHIKGVEISGNQAFSDKRLKLSISTWKSSLLFGEMKRFRQKELDKDIKKLINFYRGQRYPEVKVDSKIEKDPETKNASIFIIIHEGPRYDIEFKGNKEFWDFTLRKDLILFKEGNKGDFGLRKSIRRIRDRYRKAGFLDARVKTESAIVDDDGRALRKIRLLIEEGAQYIVNTITITGNHAFDDEEIKKQMLTRRPGVLAKGKFVAGILEEDIRAITSLYLKEGYMNIRVTCDDVTWREDQKEGKKLVDVALNIEEGVQTRVVSLTLNGLTALRESEVMEAIALRKGEVFRSYMILSDENTLSSSISEKGYPHVKVKGRAAMSEDGAEAAVSYDIDEGPFVKMGQVYYTGNFRTKGRVIKRAVELEPGEAFSLSKMLASQRNVRDIEAFDSVHFKTPGLKEGAEKVNLLVEVEEKKPYYIQIGAGYDTERRLYGHARVGDQNLFGLNKDGWTGLEVSEIGYRGEVEITEPRFLGFPVSSTLNVSGEKREEFNQSFGTRTFAGSLSFNHRFLENYRANLAFTYERREQFQRNGDPIPPGEEDDYQPRSILVTRPSLIYNSTDSFLRPTKGILSFLSVDISKGIKNSLDDFFKYRFEVRDFFTPLERLTFGLRGRVGYIDPFDTTSSIPEDQLFFLGGISDVRGFKENMLRFDSAGNAVGGRTEILGSIEARIYLGLNFELTTFYDTGSVRNPVEDRGSDDFRSSAGLGLHYITPVGSIGIIYGHKLDRKDQESPGRFHFSLGYTF